MTDAPFFEPLPEPEEPFDEEEQVVDLPWLPPSHIAGVIAPLAVDVFRSEDVVVRVTHAVCYRRGIEVHVSAWVRPGTRPRRSIDHGHWQQEEPRVGIRLADGTRIGHVHPHAPLPPDLEDTPGPDEAPVALTPLSGGSEAWRSSSSWWLHPVPVGDTLEVVVEWLRESVPESVARIDLALLREAAGREDVLWDPPPPPGEGNHGWFAYAPMSGAFHRSGLTMSADEGEDDEDDEAEPGSG